jgi:MFS family permease
LEKQQRVAVTILATICLTYFVENFLRSAASALTPVLITELGINRGAMGALISAYFLIYGIMQFPSGVLADILGPRKSIVWFTALTCIGGAGFWLSYKYELLFASQFVMGIGTSVFYINAVTAVGRWFPPERKATAISILSAASGIGAFAAFMGFPLADTYLGGWRNLYAPMLGILVLNWVMNFLVLQDGPEPVKVQKRTLAGILKAFKEVFNDQRYRPILAGYVLNGFNFALFSWGIQYFIEDKGLTYVEAGLLSSVGTVAGFVGCILVGVASDNLRSRRIPLLACVGGNLAFLAVLIFLPAKLSPFIYTAVWVAMSVCGSIWMLFFSMAGEVLPRSKASIGLGLMNGISIILSSFITPIFGSLVDITGSYLIPNLGSLTIGAFTFLLLWKYAKETYGTVASE